MFVYERKLQYPVKVATPNPKLAAVIISQYGGPRRGTGRVPALPFPALLHALSGAEGPADRHRYRGTGAFGDDRHAGSPADSKPDRGADQDRRFRRLFCGSHYRRVPTVRLRLSVVCFHHAGHRIPSRISPRILPQSRRPVSPTTTSYAFPTIPMSTMPSSSSGNGRLSTSRDLARRCVWPRSG